MDHNEASEWINIDGTYEGQTIHMPPQGQDNLLTDIVGVPNCNIDGFTSSIIKPRPTDAKERKRQRDRDRYLDLLLEGT